MVKTSIKRITALGMRIFRQFTRDHRTAFLMFASPIIIMSIIAYLLGGPPSEIPFALVKDSPDSSMVYDVLKHGLEDEHRIQLVEIEIDNVQQALKNGLIQGALIVHGGSFDDLMGGKGASLELNLEGSDAIATKDLVIIIGGMQKRLLPAIRDVISIAGDQSMKSLTDMELKVKYLYGGEKFTPTDYLAPIILGVVAFVLTFLLTSVSFLRERSSGTMERLLVSPITRLEIILGYLLGFLIFTLLQASIILAFEIWVLKVHYVGSLSLIFVVVVLVTIGASNLGIFLSSFARTELQVAQFMPLVMVPLILVSGVLWSIDSLPRWLKPLAYASPLTWANVALRDVMIKGFGLSEILFPLALLVGFAVLFCILGAITIRRQAV